MTTVKDVQQALIARGFNVGRAGADGLIGPATLYAMLEALGRIPVINPSVLPPVVKTESVIPLGWMPWAKMERIIVHWTAGGNKATKLDKEHYHLIIEGDGNLVLGDHPITDNVTAADGDYAAHTLGCNTGSIGVSLAAMRGATQSPFNPGPSPITRAQWEKLPYVLAALCRRYSIPVLPTTVLSHAEVEKTLGIKQRGKWDIAILPFDRSFNTATLVGNNFRSRTHALL